MQSEDDPNNLHARLDTANSLIKTHIIANLTLSLVPVPVFDVAALTVTQMNMLRSLCELYDVPFDDTDIKPILIALAGGSLPVVGLLGLSSALKLIPGVGTLAGGASLSITSGALTYAVGQTFVIHFESGGTLEDFDVKRAGVFFQRELAAGKLFVAEMKKELQAAGKDNAPDQSAHAESQNKASTAKA